MYRVILIVALLLISIGVLAQNPITADSPFQVRYAANLDKFDSLINITNDGANGAPLLGPGGSEVGNLCVNVYAFSPDSQEIACCSCLVRPNGLVSLSVRNDIIFNTATPAVPKSVVVKLLSTLAGTGGTGTSCSNSAATAATATISSGMEAWMTTTHVTTTVTPSPYWWMPATTTTTANYEETAFAPSTLSAGELASIAGRCATIVGNSSGFGICRSCQLGGR